MKIDAVLCVMILFGTTGCYSVKKNPCVDIAGLKFQWKNAYIQEQNYSGSTITGNVFLSYMGYFQLNNGGTYNVLSNGAPTNGAWNIDQNNCELELDKGTSNQREFSIILLNSDSLVIKRKDTVNSVIYTQHYFK